MNDNYTPGQGCLCHAHSEAECGCDVDWTPREVYELREKLSAVTGERDEAVNNYETAVLREHRMQEQRDKLAEALREIADCDFVITLPDRMDAVRAIAREALGDIKWHKL